MKSLCMIAIGLLAVLAISERAIAAAKPAIAIVELDVHDPDRFAKEFFPLAAKIFADAGATFIVKPSAPDAVDGTAPKRVAIIQFESKEKAIDTFASPAYRDARKIGDKYASFRIFVVDSTVP